MFARRRKAVFAVLILLLGSSAAWTKPRYDSVQQVMLNGVIDNGSITVAESTTDPLPQIRAQLKYTLGQLNYEDAAPKISRFKIELGNRDPIVNGLVRIHYRAQGHIAWSRDNKIPSQFDLILPERADSKGLRNFADQYFSDCTDDSNATPEGFFYYFFPKLKKCPLHNTNKDEEAGIAVRFPIRLSVSESNTSSKYPEYSKLWEKQKLSVTVIFGKYESGKTTEDDEGIMAYDHFYSLLLANYGSPLSTDHSFEGAPGVSQPKLHMQFQRPEGLLEIRVALIDAMTKIDDNFIQWYRKGTRDSDVVIYNGHAGMGDNVDALAQLGEFTPGRYQIFFVNGCDTFTYANESLFEAHSRANPGSEPSKYLDILSNTMSNYFGWMANESFTLIDALTERKNTYRQILERFDPRQRPIVDGEEDNAWPGPF